MGGLLVACAEPPTSGEGTGDDEAVADEPVTAEDGQALRASQQRTDPLMHDLSPGTALAREVWAAAGGEELHRVAQLDFRFVVSEGDSEVFAATHRWDRRGERDRVSWVDSDGRRHEAIVNVEDGSACGHVDAEPATGEALDELAEAAHQRWVNDSYWLMVPLKLLDPGVHQGRKECEGGPAQLELTFDGVGLTPGDRYVLEVEHGRIASWEHQASGEEGARYASFGDYQQVGPLTLAMDHRMGDTRVHFSDVAAHETLQTSDFEAVIGCD